MQPEQLSLLGHETPAFDAAFSQLARTQLDDASWLDYAPRFVAGHAALMEQLRTGIRWHSDRRMMYEREVDVPRLLAMLPDDGEPPALLVTLAEQLSQRYGRALKRITLAYYRDGNDSVAWHRDRIHPRSDAIVAILSLGACRRFMVRPRGGGTSSTRSFGMGDLLVMGGASQERWEHCIPKTKHADPRISVMFRNAEEVASYRELRVQGDKATA
ncbi:MAG TPA: alpha-ketoglutarate-dependent dioxygenase AlkB, partial [Polyangiales bacterium]|nr:alpha-ketoglutarate-dependent dioxygenase AlkB [Polyangiales bacterium]